jgi:hypothetical protein
MSEVTHIPNPVEAADDHDPAKEEELFDMQREAPAVLTQDKMFSLEKAIEADREGVCRRPALTVLTKPGKHLLDEIGNDAELAAAESAQILQALGPYTERLQSLLDMRLKSEAWLMVALATREDMNELLAPAEVPERPNA